MGSSVARCRGNTGVLALAAALALLSGCATFRLQSFTPPESERRGLPPLRLEIDEASLVSTFSHVERKKVVLESMPVSRPEQVGPYTTWKIRERYAMQDVTVTDQPRLRDTRELIATALGGHGADPARATGTLQVSLTSYRVSTSCGACMFLSIVTLGTLNLLGFPGMGKQVEVELTATLLDREGRVVSRLRHGGRHTSWEALYWGYGEVEDLLRAANAGAIAEALARIRAALREGEPRPPTS